MANSKSDGTRDACLKVSGNEYGSAGKYVSWRGAREGAKAFLSCIIDPSFSKKDTGVVAI